MGSEWIKPNPAMKPLPALFDETGPAANACAPATPDAIISIRTGTITALVK
jgi:hypothetical protein